MLEKLWSDIRLIYDGLNFSSRLLIDDLMIVSQDNHYLIYYKQNEIATQIRIEKNYSLINMWEGGREFDVIDYKLSVQIGDKLEVDENHKIELTYNIITPFIRDCKLNKIGV
jgi:hypothetical protein